jgi:hypothetical protein
MKIIQWFTWKCSVVHTKLNLNLFCKLDGEGKERKKRRKQRKRRRMTNATKKKKKKKTIVTWEYTIYLQGNLFCVLETKYLNYQKKKRSLINILMFEFKTFLYPSPNKIIPITQNHSNKWCSKKRNWKDKLHFILQTTIVFTLKPPIMTHCNSDP